MITKPCLRDHLGIAIITLFGVSFYFLEPFILSFRYQPNYGGVMWVSAMLYALDQINNNITILPGIKLGYAIYDSCDSVQLTARYALNFMVNKDFYDFGSTPISRNKRDVNSVNKLDIDSDVNNNINDDTDSTNSTNNRNQLNATTTTTTTTPTKTTTTTTTTKPTTTTTTPTTTTPTTTTPTTTTPTTATITPSATTVPTNNNNKEAHPKLIGIVGGAGSSISALLNNIIASENMPQISYSSTSESLAQDWRFPSFLRTVPSDKHLAVAIVDMIRFFDWTYVSAFAIDDEYGRVGLQELQASAKKSGKVNKNKTQKLHFKVFFTFLKIQ